MPLQTGKHIVYLLPHLSSSELLSLLLVGRHEAEPLAREARDAGSVQSGAAAAPALCAVPKVSAQFLLQPITPMNALFLLSQVEQHLCLACAFPFILVFQCCNQMSYSKCEISNSP